MYRDITIKSTTPADVARQLLDQPVGYTITRTAKMLGLTQQGVDKAIRRGALRATRIYMEGRKPPLSTEVDRESVTEYLNARGDGQRVRYGYRDDQQSLPISS